MTVLLLHGPNLGLLGERDPRHYGSSTQEQLVAVARDEAVASGADLHFEQHDDEGSLVRRLHAARSDGSSAVVINPGALSHYSYALRDALESLDAPKVEVHLSQVHRRERFRHTSVTAAACDGLIVGLGAVGYALAVRAVVSLVREREASASDPRRGA